MGKKSLIYAASIVIIVSTALGQGTTGFETLRSETGVRGSAMAGAMIALDSGIEGLYYNPAALGEVEDHRVQGTYHNHILDIESGFFAYCQKVRTWGTFGIGLNYMNYGQFKVTNTNGVQTDETFRPTDLLFTFGYGRKIGEIVNVGANFKYIRSEIWNVSSSATAFDLGGQVDLPFEQLTLGAGIFNIGKTLDGFYDYKDELPLAYKIGLSKPLEHLPLVIGVQLDKFKDSDFYFSAGGEFTLNEMFRLRLGWSTRGQDQHMDTNADIFAGTSAGLGFISENVHIDYSLMSMGELGLQSRYSVSVFF